eukprot:1163799-Lingulodinium_polyedra.AAC.1
MRVPPPGGGVRGRAGAARGRAARGRQELEEVPLVARHGAGAAAALRRSPCPAAGAAGGRAKERLAVPAP